MGSLDADKAENIEIYNIDQHSALADYMVVANGSSARQVVRLAEKVIDRLGVRGLKSLRVEGLSQGDWVIIDAGDVILHLFRPEVREFYNIEKIWDPEAFQSSGGQSPSAHSPLEAV